MCVEIVRRPLAVFLSPTPALEINFTHPDRHLRGSQVCYWNGLDVLAHGDAQELTPGSDNDAFNNIHALSRPAQFDPDQQAAWEKRPFFNS